jgi:hypothetical protein
MLSFSNAHSFGLRAAVLGFFLSPAQAADGGAEEGGAQEAMGNALIAGFNCQHRRVGLGNLPLLSGKTKTRFAPTGGSYDAGQFMIGTVLMLFCGLPAMTRSLEDT